MKKIGYVMAGFAGALILFVVLGAAVMKNEVFLVDESKYSFDETSDRLEALAKEGGWTISHIYNLQATMEKNGYSVQPLLVYSLCKPSIAHKILGSDNERPTSVMMPCRVSIYMTSDGKTHISRMKASAVSSMLSGVSKEAMVLASDENEKMIEQLVK